MKILSLDPKKNNTQAVNKSKLKFSKKQQRSFNDLVEMLELSVLRDPGLKHSFVEFEQFLLELANEACSQVIARHLKRISRKYESELLFIDGVLYKRHEFGTVDYHSLCGSIKIARYTYRSTLVRNGPTLVPMDLAAGLMEKATPALAYRAALGDAQCPGRQWEEQLRASYRQPPSRSTLERIAKSIGSTVRKCIPEILPVVRKDEKIHEDAVAVSIGLDRTTIPMEEKTRHSSNVVPLKRRKKPYVRKPPEPVEVNYRMGYVGTVSMIGDDGRSIQTNKYGCSADKDPGYILKKHERLSAARAEIMRTHLTYIKNNKHYMRYASLRRKGLPTGSGATEGACKSLIMIRAKGCGQRWHSPGVNSVLTLRGLYLSERLLPFWNQMQNNFTNIIQIAA